MFGVDEAGASREESGNQQRQGTDRRRPMTARTKPPYRADHVGSILRSATIKDARAKHEAGKLSDAELKAVEDREIDTIIKKQEDIGLKLTTDGEYRRSWWHFDFFGM